MALNSASSLPNKLLRLITSQQLFKPDDCLIVGVSGGADSIALLHLLHNLPDFPLRLIVAHLNHCLRGAESDSDETFVQQFAADLGLIFENRRKDIQAAAGATNSSLEEAGRTARYHFFEELRTKHQASAIVVAHHLDDQAETLLMRLLRGSGTTGLGGMRLVTNAHIIRPLLQFSRSELLAYLQEQGLTHREDQSNSDQSYLRNRIRHQLLPLLTDYNPSISEQLAVTAHLLQEDEALLADYARSYYQALASSTNDWVSLPRNGLLELRPGLRTRLYRMSIEQLQGNLQRIERKHLLQLDACLLAGRTGSSLNLPNNLIGLLTADQLRIGYQQELHPAPPIQLTITSYGSYDLGNGLTLQVEQAVLPEYWDNLPPDTTYIDLQQAPFPWLVRPHIPGERMQPLGMDSSRKIQDILTDRKIPRHLRPTLPLLCSNDQQIWLAGACRSHKALLTQDSNSVVLIRLCGAALLS